MTNLTSEAHTALDMLQNGEATTDRGVVGYNFADGSVLEYSPVYGWGVAKCVTGCDCLAEKVA